MSKKAKLLKLDPSQHKSTAELQAEIEKQEKILLETENEDVLGLKPIKVSSMPSASLEELREKLHSKMTVLRGKRKLHTEDTKKDLKKSRTENKETEIAKLKRLKESKNIKRATEVEELLTKVDTVPKNDVGELVFSKFDFANGNPTPKKKKNIHKLLQEAEKKKEKLQKMKEENKDKFQEIEKQEAWNNAVKKAEGIKIKDDPKLLKKAIKNKEKLKVKSKKKWEERVETLETQKKDKQKQRKEHLKERRDGSKASKSKNINKKKKKPGF